jgi:hypothetical protein
MADYASFADKPMTACRRVSGIPKKKRKAYVKTLGARITTCDCCGASILAAPSSMRQKKESGVPLVCDTCGAEIMKLSRGGYVAALAPGAAEEFYRASITPDGESLN